MRKFYGISHNSNSINDSAEKIREWNTADVLAFDSRRARDEWSRESAYNVPCTATFARRAGYKG